ncbi:Shedu anti-phage system protein SduA domain-containing protein [Coleofasciculus sp. B1-GNL1-01]|uniref:Shedu anti-phage system protein SduA domain-containing protein n=1 Tax=Coleofasciculus sp. B1-GNL1-01 TaxID=3068484 RepID=UPI0040629106
MSQIIDWFWKLDDLEKTNDYENRFNSRSIDYMGLLIIGRNENLKFREKTRLAWRQQNLIVNSKHILYTV